MREGREKRQYKEKRKGREWRKKRRQGRESREKKILGKSGTVRCIFIAKRPSITIRKLKISG